MDQQNKATPVNKVAQGIGVVVVALVGLIVISFLIALLVVVWRWALGL